MYSSKSAFFLVHDYAGLGKRAEKTIFRTCIRACLDGEASFGPTDPIYFSGRVSQGSNMRANDIKCRICNQGSWRGKGRQGYRCYLHLRRKAKQLSGFPLCWVALWSALVINLSSITGAQDQPL